MPVRWFHVLLVFVAAGFSAFFCATVLPPVIESGDVLGAFAAGFVNPYASGYSVDVCCCWLVLAIWTTHEARTLGIKHGWICLLLGIMPGVVVGLAVYLILRGKQLAE